MIRADGLEVRFIATDAEREQATAVAQAFRNTAAMGNVWTRWEAWERNPPIVALEHGQVVGVHAAMFGLRNGYMNTYYLAVLPTHHRRGIAQTMVGVGLCNAMRLNLARLKMRAEEGLPGEFFWRRMGAVPIAIQRGDLIFDVDLSGLYTGETIGAEEAARRFAAWMRQPERHLPIPPKAQAAWERMKAIRMYTSAEREAQRMEYAR